MTEIETLEALLSDVQGNGILGDAKNMSGYLRSISLLAGAMSRRYWQTFEMDVIDELKGLGVAVKLSKGLQAKQKLNQRELELAELEVQLANFHACAGSGCFVTKEDAAAALRKIADDLELKDSVVFPPPMTVEQMRAWAKDVGAHFVEPGSPESESILSRLRGPKGAKTKKGQGGNVVKLRAWPPACT